MSCDLDYLNKLFFPWNFMTTGPVAFEKMLKLSYCESPGSKVKQWPWPLVLIYIHVLITTNVFTNVWAKIFQTFHEILCIRISPYLTLPCNRLWSTQGHHLNNLGSTRVLDATCKLSCPSINWFWRRYLEAITIYGCGGHTGHVTWTVWTYFCSPQPRRLHMKCGYNRLRGFWFWGDDCQIMVSRRSKVKQWP